MFRLHKFSLLILFVSLLFIVFTVTAADEYTYLYSLPEEELAKYALSGNTALVGFQNETVKAYISSPTGWVEQGLLTPTSPYEDYQAYGKALALDGDTAAVSLTGYCQRGGDSGEEPPETLGSVFIFQRTGTTWTQQHEIEVPCSVDEIALEGTTLAVSEYGRFEGYEAFIHFFEYNGTAWVAAGNAHIDGENSGEGLAGPAAIHGDTAIVIGETPEGFESEPVVLIFKRTSGMWSLHTTLAGPSEPHRPLSVAFDGQTVILGNLVYVLNGSTWTLQQTFDLPYESDLYFAIHAAIEGDTAVVSTNEYTGDPFNYIQHAYLFKRTGTTWTSTEMLVNGEGISGQAWLSGDLALVGPHTFAINDSPVDPTATPIMTDEVTPTPVSTEEPTASPSATSTPEDNEPLNSNTGFEGGNDISPWTVTHGSGDKLKCSTEKPIAHSGNCAFQFKNVENDSGKLQQTIDFTSRTSLTGSSLELSLFARTKAKAEGEARVVVKYSDGSKQKFSVEIANADGAYAEFSQTAVLIQTDIAKVKLTVKGRNSKGKFYVDDIVIQSLEGAGSFNPLPLPAN
jgi:hypothetical protein